VKPGQPFAIVENPSSKRKTETQFTITEDNRVFGPDSLIQGNRFPKTTFSDMMAHLGHVFSEEEVEFLKKEKFVTNELVPDSRGYIGWKVTKKGEEEAEILYTEELIAMLLKYGKQLAETQSGGSVKDCVITIPSYFSSQERRMMLDAAELAQLSVLQLIHENTAAATMFGIDRMDVNDTYTIAFYNMGGTDTEVSIARYGAVKDGSNKTSELIEILGEGYDRHLGGRDFDDVLVGIMADRFNSMKEREGKPSVRTNERAMKRLYKEARKAKDVLSANKLVIVKVTELMDYVTLSATIERSEFEEKAAHVFEKVVAPLKQALLYAGLEMSDLQGLEILGGGLRVPKVTEILQAETGLNTDAHLNGDEAMCFGAAFIASNSSASFKVRHVYLTQHPQHSIRVQIKPATEQPGESPDGIEYYKDYLLYKRTDFLGGKKSVSINYD